jgi:hypothetical protein
MLHDDIIQSLIDFIKFSICLCEFYMRLYKIRLNLSSFDLIMWMLHKIIQNLIDSIEFRFVYVNVTWDYTKLDWLYQVLNLFMWMLHEIIQNLIDFIEFSICLCKCYTRLYKIRLTLSSSQFVYVNVTWDHTKLDW